MGHLLAIPCIRVGVVGMSLRTTIWSSVSPVSGGWRRYCARVVWVWSWSCVAILVVWRGGGDWLLLLVLPALEF